MITKAVIRKDLNADAMIALLRKEFERIPDSRINPTITLADALMSGFALFSLKDPSLLIFEQDRKDDPTIKSIYHIDTIPSDTAMRTILDEVQPKMLEPIYKKIFAIAQRGKALEDMVFYQGHYLISNDGTGYFSSEKVHCDECLVKNHKNGDTEYYHQFLGSVLVHPDRRVVIPLCPEPIKKVDGSTKNDCERNASKRWLERFRREHPHLKTIIVADALASNAPHIKELQKHNVRYIIGIKKGSHSYLFSVLDETPTTDHEMTDAKGVHHRFRFVNDVALNDGNPDVRVNVIEYWEEDAKGNKQHFSWVTDLPVTVENVYTFMRGGRARWKIENETFNTLKNQEYRFEHNFGHGDKYLSTVFAHLMMFAFLIDQVQQKCCTLFQEALKICFSKRSLWRKIRSLVEHSFLLGASFARMSDILFMIAYRTLPPG